MLENLESALVEAEIENGEMYQRLLALTSDYPDVQQVFLNLQRASQENHLPAFQRCAERSVYKDSSSEENTDYRRGRGKRRREHCQHSGRRHSYC